MPKDASMPMSGAIEFAEANGLSAEVKRIKATLVFRHFDRVRQVRKALLLDLFEERGLLDEFIAKEWPAGATEAGRQRRESYRRDLEINRRYVNGESVVTDEQRECIVALLNEGELTKRQIAEKLGLSPGVISVAEAEEEVENEGGGKDDTEEETDSGPFAIERDLQLALRAHIEQLEPGLVIIDAGKERSTDAGRIDITAQDREGTVVVIELKAGVAKPGALTQVLAYMAAVAEEDKKPVRGMLVASGFDTKVCFGARAVPNVQLRQYRFKFTFEAVG
jgi:endonuclease